MNPQRPSIVWRSLQLLLKQIADNFYITETFQIIAVIPSIFWYCFFISVFYSVKLVEYFMLPIISCHSAAANCIGEGLTGEDITCNLPSVLQEIK